MSLCRESRFDLVTVGAQRMRELHDEVAGWVRSELREIEVLDAAGLDAAHARQDPVDLASNAEPGRCREERQGRDHAREDVTDRRGADDERERRRTQEDRAD